MFFLVVFVLVSCGSALETDCFSTGFTYNSSGSKPVQEVFCGIHTTESTNAFWPIQIEFYIGVPEYSFNDDLSSIIIYATNSNKENRVSLQTITNFNENDFTYNIVENSDDTFLIKYTYSIET